MLQRNLFENFRIGQKELTTWVIVATVEAGNLLLTTSLNCSSVFRIVVLIVGCSFSKNLFRKDTFLLIPHLKNKRDSNKGKEGGKTTLYASEIPLRWWLESLRWFIRDITTCSIYDIIRMKGNTFHITSKESIIVRIKRRAKRYDS